MHILLERVATLGFDERVVFIERSEEYLPIIGSLVLTWSQWQSLDDPDSIDLEITKVL